MRHHRILLTERDAMNFKDLFKLPATRRAEEAAAKAAALVEEAKRIAEEEQKQAKPSE